MCHIFIAFHKYEMAKMKMCKIEREKEKYRTNSKTPVRCLHR